MTQQEFENLREDIFTTCKSLTKTKGDDYTKGNQDVLINFKEGGTDLGVSELKTLGIYMKKHVDAIFNYIKTEGQSESEPINMRIVDCINYLIFMQALIKDKEYDK